MYTPPLHGRLLLLLVCLTGCAQLHREQVTFEHLSACPRLTPAALSAGQPDLGPSTDTHTLECALHVLRHTQDPALRRGSLGSRLCLYLAEREADPDRRERLAAEGVRFAEAAVAAGGDGDGAVHYYLAANLGLAVRDRITLAMDNLARLEAEMKRATALSPDIDDGGPLRLLGALYLKAPTWPNGIGDADKALALLEQAVTRHPGHPLNYLFYAEAIWELDEEGAGEKVRAALNRGLELLREGRWGYRKEAWQREFAEFQAEMGATGS